jgi:tetratricopeptide (TPR) repeat protein
VALFQKNDPAGAVACHQRALALAPDTASTHSNLGNELWSQRDLGGASCSYHRALELDPQLATAHNGLGVALRDKGDLPGAFAAWRKAVALDPKYALAHCNLGVALAAQKDLDGAIACYRKAAAVEPQMFAAHALLGDALKARGDLDGAVASYRKAAALSPGHAAVHNALGAALQTKKDFDGAVASYLEAVTLRPGYAEAHRNLGTALALKGAYAGAALRFGKARQLQPGNAATWCDQAMACLGAGDLKGYRAACADLLGRFAGTKDPATAARVLRACLAAPGAGADAAALARLAEAVTPEAARDSLLAAALYRAGKYEGAVKRVDGLARSGYLLAWDWYVRAMAQHRLGRGGEARQSLGRAARWVADRRQAEEAGKQRPLAWWYRVELEHLRREAEELVKGADPAKENEVPPERPGPAPAHGPGAGGGEDFQISVAQFAGRRRTVC